MHTRSPHCGRWHRAEGHAPSGAMKHAHDARACRDVRGGCAKSSPRRRRWHGRVQSRCACGTEVSNPVSSPGADVAMWPGRVPSSCRCGRDASEHTGAESAAALVRRQTVPIYEHKRTDDWIKHRNDNPKRPTQAWRCERIGRRSWLRHCARASGAEDACARTRARERVCV